MSIDLASLKREFEKHIDSMTDEELTVSIKKAAELTAGCDDWPNDLIQVVYCQDCIHRCSLNCPMFIITSDPPWDDIIEDRTEDNGFCYKGEHRTYK